MIEWLFALTWSPLDLACSKLIDLPCEIRISPGDDIDRKQHENNSSSHHELISRQIWSSICNCKSLVKLILSELKISQSFYSPKCSWTAANFCTISQFCTADDRPHCTNLQSNRGLCLRCLWGQQGVDLRQALLMMSHPHRFYTHCSRLGWAYWFLLHWISINVQHP